MFITMLFMIAKKQKKIRKSINWLMDRQSVVYPYGRILFSNEKQVSKDTGYSVVEPRWRYSKWKKPATEDCIRYYMIPFIGGVQKREILGLPWWLRW